MPEPGTGPRPGGWETLVYKTDTPHFYVIKTQFLQRYVEHSSPPNAEDKTEWSYTATPPPRAFTTCTGQHEGRDNAVGIATRYGDRIPVGGEIFPHSSRPDLVPTQPPIQWVPGLSLG